MGSYLGTFLYYSCIYQLTVTDSSGSEVRVFEGPSAEGWNFETKGPCLHDAKYTVIIKRQETYRDKTFQAPFHSSCVLLSNNLWREHPKHPCELECVHLCTMYQLCRVISSYESYPKCRRGSKRCRADGVVCTVSACTTSGPSGAGGIRQAGCWNELLRFSLSSWLMIYFLDIHGITRHHSLAC